MKVAIADGHALDDILVVLSEGRVVYAPRPEGTGRYRLVRAASWERERHTLGPYRCVEPVKSLLFPPRERIGTWGGGGARAPVPERIVFGVKNCDLSGLAVQDRVFLGGGLVDPDYAEARDKTLLVTADCTDFLDVCFCPAVGEQPYPESGFDVNVSATPMGYVLETGTARGAQALRAADPYLEPASDALLEARQQQRSRKYDAVAAHSRAFGLEPGADLQRAVEGAFDSELWQEFAADCVECGACNFVCCTCHCFLLADGLDSGGCPVRSKLWDSCLFRNFASTAGGGNARPLRAQRLRNRFEKKFSFFPRVLGRYACDGCGRCTEACIAKIDIRRVLKRAVDESNAVHADTGEA